MCCTDLAKDHWGKVYFKDVEHNWKEIGIGYVTCTHDDDNKTMLLQVKNIENYSLIVFTQLISPTISFIPMNDTFLLWKNEDDIQYSICFNKSEKRNSILSQIKEFREENMMVNANYEYQFPNLQGSTIQSIYETISKFSVMNDNNYFNFLISDKGVFIHSLLSELQYYENLNDITTINTLKSIFLHFLNLDSIHYTRCLFGNQNFEMLLGLFEYSSSSHIYSYRTTYSQLSQYNNILQFNQNIMNSINININLLFFINNVLQDYHNEMIYTVCTKSIEITYGLIYQQIFTTQDYIHNLTSCLSSTPLSMPLYDFIIEFISTSISIASLKSINMLHYLLSDITFIPTLYTNLSNFVSKNRTEYIEKILTILYKLCYIDIGSIYSTSLNPIKTQDNSTHSLVEKSVPSDASIDVNSVDTYSDTTVDPSDMIITTSSTTQTDNSSQISSTLYSVLIQCLCNSINTHLCIIVFDILTALFSYSSVGNSIDLFPSIQLLLYPYIHNIASASDRKCNTMRYYAYKLLYTYIVSNKQQITTIYESLRDSLIFDTMVYDFTSSSNLQLLLVINDYVLYFLSIHDTYLDVLAQRGLFYAYYQYIVSTQTEPTSITNSIFSIYTSILKQGLTDYIRVITSIPIQNENNSIFNLSIYKQLYEYINQTMSDLSTDDSLPSLDSSVPNKRAFSDVDMETNTVDLSIQYKSNENQDSRRKKPVLRTKQTTNNTILSSFLYNYENKKMKIL